MPRSSAGRPLVPIAADAGYTGSADEARAHEPTSPSRASARLFRHRRGAHLQVPQPRQPDALRARLRRQPSPSPSAPATRRWRRAPTPPRASSICRTTTGRASTSWRCPRAAGWSGVELLDEADRPAELPPSAARGLRAGARAGRAVAGAARPLRPRGAHPLELLHQPGHGRRHRHVRPRALPGPVCAAADRGGRTGRRAGADGGAEGGAGK